MQTEETSIELTRVRVTQPFLVAGQILPVGDVIDLLPADAADLIRRDRAELVD